ncbi:Collagen-binding surface protein [Streptococcus australis]|uniref:LPXTG-motif cell wall anchor domain protein n=1 Tax=Streptococcus australis ATCC 700641 TaxID=888833 RepID=E7S9B3_9STRE|nr:Cna B-type domain-containing protein [Streptococcus australis]EFV99883.1 LPXTG-motif cell wall anchor domain protein [Streptococcus australis ATCC 700641]SQH67131.1 Collagen-binding surface protein [Streptococcus australis]
MKKWLYAVVTTVALFLLAALGFAKPNGLTKVHADTINDVVSSVNISKSTGGDLTEPLGVWESFNVEANFVLPNGRVKAGDQTVIQLGDDFKVFETDTIELLDPSGQKVATATVDDQRKIITVTYTDYPERMANVTGKLRFFARVDHQVVKGQKTLDFTLTVDTKKISGGKIDYKGVNPGEYPPTPKVFSKWGWTNSDDKLKLTYTLNINQGHTALHNIDIKDQLAFTDGKIKADSVNIHTGTWQVSDEDGAYHLRDTTNVTKDYSPVVSADGQSLTVHIGDLAPEQGMTIRYDVYLDKVPAINTKYKNNATMTATEVKEQHKEAVVLYQFLEGYFNGEKYSFTIHKKGENGQVLAGAVFTVTADDTGEQVGIITTDENGTGTIAGLIKQAYTVQEIQAPTGYVLSEEPIKVSREDFGNDLAISRDVVNKKEKTSISGQKTWNDNDNQDGKRPSAITVNLLANGVKVASKEVKPDAEGNWLYQFDNLDVVDDAGNLIAYTVSEEPVAGYEATVEGTNITNSRTPEVTEVAVKKVWDDAENKDGLRPEKVTVRLLADGQEVAVKEITATDNWQASFTDLPVYKEGKKIAYTITEDPVAGYTATIDGFTVINRHTPPTTPPSTSEKPETPPTPTEGKRKILPSTGEATSYGLFGASALLALVGAAMLLSGKRKVD